MKGLGQTMVFISVFIFGANGFAQDKEGWKNLFDGKSLKGWKTLGGKAVFSVENGVITGTTVLHTGNTFLATEKEYSDFILELDVKIEDSFNNSGIQTRSHFDPAGNEGRGKVFGRQVELDPTERRWTGGIFDEGRRGWLYRLSLNPEAQQQFRFNEFNHFKIECTGNEMKTWVNGKAAAYLVDTVDRKGFIALQVHAIYNEAHAGKKIYFKNIRIKTNKLKPASFEKNIYVVNLQPNTLSDYEKSDGWKLLFDGRSSGGWKSAKADDFPEKGWKIENGTLTVLPADGAESGNGGDIITKEKFSSFDLSFNFRLTPGANSGLKYFVTMEEKTKGSAKLIPFAPGLSPFTSAVRQIKYLQRNCFPDFRNSDDAARTKK